MNKPINKLVHVTEELPREKHNPLIKKITLSLSNKNYVIDSGVTRGVHEKSGGS